MSLPQLANIRWLRSNAHRNYPMHDRASRVDDVGAQLPSDVVVDAHIWFPDSLGTTAFISSVGLSENLVSLTISAGDAAFTPLAGVTLPRPIDEFRNYPLNPLIDGVSGWISFGPGAVNVKDKSYVFSFDPSADTGATELLPRLAKAYTVDGVTSLRKEGRADGLVGLVNIISEQPSQLSIIKGQRVVEGFGLVDALIFRLNDEVAGPEIYREFASACDVTPDSETCLRPPIQAINEAVPDCDCAITIIFEEEVNPELGKLSAPAVVDNRVVIDFLLGLGDICPEVDALFKAQVVSQCEDVCAGAEGGPFESYAPRFSSTP